MLLQELFGTSMKRIGNMNEYLRAVKEKFSELTVIGTKLEDDIKLAIILNGLPEKYRYLTVALEQQKEIDFDELTAKLLEEAKLHVESDLETTAMMARKDLSKNYGCYHCGQKGHLKRNCRIKVYQEKMRICSNDEEAKKRPDARIAM